MSGKARLRFNLFPSLPKGSNTVICQSGQEDNAGNACQASRRAGRQASEFVEFDGRRHPKFSRACFRFGPQGQQCFVGDL